MKRRDSWRAIACPQCRADLFTRCTSPNRPCMARVARAARLWDAVHKTGHRRVGSRNFETACKVWDARSGGRR